MDMSLLGDDWRPDMCAAGRPKGGGHMDASPRPPPCPALCPACARTHTADAQSAFALSLVARPAGTRPACGPTQLPAVRLRCRGIKQVIYGLWRMFLLPESGARPRLLQTPCAEGVGRSACSPRVCLQQMPRAPPLQTTG